MQSQDEGSSENRATSPTESTQPSAGGPRQTAQPSLLCGCRTRKEPVAASPSPPKPEPAKAEPAASPSPPRRSSA